jgi:hypothetical protein
LELWQHIEEHLMRIAVVLVVLIVVLTCPTPAVTAEVTIQAEKAAIRTEGGPLPGGCWNLWSNGRVGQSLRFTTAGNYGIVVRAWGSPAGGVWPEMALLVDGRAILSIMGASSWWFLPECTPGRGFPLALR